jgi:hypothetical protein
MLVTVLVLKCFDIRKQTNFRTEIYLFVYLHTVHMGYPLEVYRTEIYCDGISAIGTNNGQGSFYLGI